MLYANGSWNDVLCLNNLTTFFCQRTVTPHFTQLQKTLDLDMSVNSSNSMLVVTGYSGQGSLTFIGASPNVTIVKSLTAAPQVGLPGTNRTLTVNSSYNTGTVTVTLTATDSQGISASLTFVVQVFRMYFSFSFSFSFICLFVYLFICLFVYLFSFSFCSFYNGLDSM